MVFSHEGERKSEMKTRKAFVLSGRRHCLAQRRRGAEEFLDRINKINRILAWRTGDTEDGVFWHGEQEKQEENWGCHTPH